MGPPFYLSLKTSELTGFESRNTTFTVKRTFYLEPGSDEVLKEPDSTQELLLPHPFDLLPPPGLFLTPVDPQPRNRVVLDLDSPLTA